MRPTLASVRLRNTPHLDYIRLQSIAARGDDIDKMKELEVVVSAALEWRELARAQVKMHDMNVHQTTKPPT